LTAKGVDFESIDYMEERLSAGDLKGLLRGAELRPRDALRTKRSHVRQHVAGKNLSDDKVLRIMAEYPELIQRPIALRENKAVLARPVEKPAELGIKQEAISGGEDTCFQSRHRLLSSVGGASRAQCRKRAAHCQIENRMLLYETESVIFE
jgi:arsenate reductase